MANLAAKFQAASLRRYDSVACLKKDTQYRVLQAERVETRFGKGVTLKVQLHDDEEPFLVILPRKYSEAIEDRDIEDVNSQRVVLYIMFHGTLGNSKAYHLSMSAK